MLKLATKTRYAVRIMAYLAGRNTREPVRISEISEAESITPDYAEQILARLKAAGLVNSHRGIHGGFTLTCAPNETSVADIVRVTEGEIALAPCSKGDCRLDTQCAVKTIWQKVDSAVNDILSGTTLQAIADEALRSIPGATLSFDI